MNCNYRLVWCERTACFVAVSEHQPGRGKRSGGGRAARRAATVLAATAAVLGAHAQTLAPPAATALPQGGAVVAGQATLNQSGARLDVNQASNKAVLNWQSFSIGAGAQVNFNQPGRDAMALNRVTGSDPSQIMGKLTANGSVVLVNANGVLFGKTAAVDVGGLVASSLAIRDADFLGGKLQFDRGDSTASVINRGSINAAAGGVVGLFGTGVANSGTISVPGGTAALGSGESVTLTLGSASGGGAGAALSVDPGLVSALVSNSELVVAEGGQVLMSARAANALLGATVRNSGVVSATSLSADGGTIRLVADGTVENTGAIRADGVRGGQVQVQAGAFQQSETSDAAAAAGGGISARGTAGAGGRIDVVAQAGTSTLTGSVGLDASGSSSGGAVTLDAGKDGILVLSSAARADGGSGAGGSVAVTGGTVGLLGGQVSADGATRGGHVDIGGEWQGGGALRHADTTYVNAAAAVSARGGDSGGQVVVWSDKATVFEGRIDTAATTAGGTGGAVEVSSKGDLSASGQVDAGRGGKLLYDPTNLVVKDNFGWDFLARLAPHSNVTLNQGASETSFGAALAIDGNVLAIGAPTFGSIYGGNTGAVMMFSGASATVNGKPDLRWLVARGNILTPTTRTNGVVINGAYGPNADNSNNFQTNVGATPALINAWGVSEGDPLTAYFPVADDNGLQANMRFGSALALRNGVLAVGAPGIREANAADIGAVFMFSGADTGALVQRRVIVTGAQTSAITGNASGHDESGARDANGQLVPGSAGARFGAAVALDGDRLVVGAPGANNGRGQVYTFTGLAAAGVLKHPNALVPNHAYFNGAYVTYTDPNGNTFQVEEDGSYFWARTQWTDLNWAGSVLNNSGTAAGSGNVTFAPGSTAAFGSAVALRNDVLAVGAPGTGGSANGKVYLFDGVGTNFSGLNAVREIGAGALPAGMAAPAAGSGFGSSLALAEDLSNGGYGGTLAAGAPGSDTVHLFTYTPSSGLSSLVYWQPLADPFLPSGSAFGTALTFDATGSLLFVSHKGGSSTEASSTNNMAAAQRQFTVTVPNLSTQGEIAEFNQAQLRAAQALSPYMVEHQQVTTATANVSELTVFMRNDLARQNSLAALGNGAQGTTFATASGQNTGVTAKSIAAVLSAGTSVTLQASNDISVLSNVTATPANGVTPGNLTLQAGRNVDIKAQIATAGGSVLIAAGDPGAVSGQTQAGTPVISFSVNEKLRFFDMFNFIGGYPTVGVEFNYATYGQINLGGAGGLKGDIALIAAGGYLRALVGPAAGQFDNTQNTTTPHPFVNQSSWLAHVSDMRVAATGNNTLVSATNVGNQRTYTVASAEPGTNGNWFTWFRPVNTYDSNAQTGSSVSLVTYTGHWLGTANQGFSFANRGASFNFYNPWFDMASNYALGFSENAQGQVVNVSGTVQTVGAGRKVDSGWSQEWQPTLTVRPKPTSGTYTEATDLNPVVGNTITQSGSAWQITGGWVDGDLIVPTSSVGMVNGEAQVTLLGNIRGNDGVGRNEQGLSGGSVLPYGKITAGMFSTTRVPTSEAAGGSQGRPGTGYDIYFNATGTATMRAGMTYGSGKVAGARTNTTLSKYVFVDDTTSTGEYTQFPFMLPPFYTATTKSYNVLDTMQIVWNVPGGGASGTGTVGSGGITWGGSSGSTAGYIGDVAYNASTQTYIYTHASTGDVYRVPVTGTTGVISNQGFAGSNPVFAFGIDSKNVLPNGTLLGIANWLGLPNGTVTGLMPANSASLSKVSGYAGTNFSMSPATGTITPVPLNFTSSRPYDGTSAIAPGDIKTLSGYDPAWAFALDGAQNSSLGTASPTFSTYGLGSRALITGSATSPTPYATTNGPVNGISAGSLALGPWVGQGYYLDFSNPASTVGISPLTVTVNARKTYDTATTISGLATANAQGYGAGTSGISFTSINGNAAVNTLLGADLADPTKLTLQGDVSTLTKNANADTTGTLLGGQTAKQLDLSNLSFTGAASGSWLFNSTASANTAIVRQAPLTVSGVAIQQKAFDNTTAATISNFGAISGRLTSAGNVVDDVTLSSSGATAVFGTATVANGKPVTITGYTVSGGDVANYAFTQPAGVTGNIGPLTLGATWTRYYDASTTFSATNLGIGAALPTYQLVLSGVPAGATAPTLSGNTTSSSANAGSYASLSTTNLAFSDPLTYTLGTLTGVIAPRPISSIVASANNKNYDATSAGSGSISGYTPGAGISGTGTASAANNISTISGNGVISGTSVTFSGSPTFTFASPNVARDGSNNVTSQVVTVGGLTSTNANYTYSGTVGASVLATISPKALTLAGLTVPGSRVYDGTTGAVVSGSVAFQATTTANGAQTVDGQRMAADAGASALALTGTAVGSYNGANVSGAGVGNVVTFGGYSLTGTSAANYTMTPYTQAASITPATANFTAKKQYDAATGFSNAQVFDGNGNALSATGVTFTSATVASANASTWSGSAWSTQSLTFSGLNLGVNYSAGSSTATILPKLLSVSGTRAYDYADTSLASTTWAFTGLVGSQTLTVSGSGGSVSSANAGNRTAGFTLGSQALANGSNGGLAANYIWNPVSAMGYGSSGLQLSSYTITPRSVTLTPGAVTKTYDGTTAASNAGLLATLSGQLRGSDTVTAATIAFASRNAGSANRTLNLSGVTLADGNGGGNYSLTLAPNTASTINRAAIGFTTSAVTKTYDGSTAANGTISIASGQLFGSDSRSGGVTTFATKDVSRDVNGVVQSDKTLNASGVSINDGNGGNNYSVSYTANTTSRIDPAALTLAGTRIYDATSAVAGSALVASGVNGETFAVSGSGNASNLTSKNVQSGSTLASLTGLALGSGNSGAAVAGNYTGLSTTGSSFSITQSTLTVAGTRVYDGTSQLDGGLLTAQGVAGESFAVSGTGASGNLASANVGSGLALASASGLALGAGSGGALVGNYAALSAASGSISITQADLVLSGSRVYNGATSVAGSTLTATGVHGETFAVTGSGNSSNLASKDVQSASLLASLTGLSLGSSGNGGLSGNYHALSTAASGYSITPAALTLAGSRVYDGSSITAGSVLTASGVAGETFAVTGAGSGGNSRRNVGTSALTSVAGFALGSSGNGGLVGNYQALSTTGSALTVSAKAVTLTAPVVSKVYDATTTYTASGADLAALSGQLGVAGDTVGAITLAYTNANAGSGNRSVNASGATVADGNGGANYSIGYAGNATSTITPAALVLSGTRTFDGGTTVAGSVLTAAGVAGQTFSVSGSGAGSNLASRNVGTQSLASLAGLALGSSGNGGASGNYQALSAAGSSVVITPKSVTLTLPTVSKVYDGTLLYTATSQDVAAMAGPLVGGDTVGGLTMAFTDKNVGSGNKTVTGSTVTIVDALTGLTSGNYSATYTGNSASSITPALLVIGGGRSYDGSTAIAGSALTASGVSVNGVVESFALAGNGAALASRNVGSYGLAGLNTLALGAGSNGALSSNYQALSTTGSAVAITAKAVTLVAPNLTKTYDASGAYSVLAGDLAALSALLGVSGDTVSAATFAFTTVDAGNGNRTVATSAATVADGNNGANYVVGYGANTTSTIAKANLVLGGSRVFDGSTAVAGSTLTATGVAGQTFAVSGSGAAGNLASRNVGSGVLASVGGLALGAGNGLASNYNALATTGSSYAVTQAALVLSGTRSYDGSTAVAGSTLTAQGVAGESFSVSGSGTQASRNVGTRALQSLGSLALGSGNNGQTLTSNYLALGAAGSAVTTTAKAVTLTAPVVSKVYDAGLGYTASGADLAALGAQLGVAGDTVSAAALAFTNANAGSANRTLNIASAALADGNNGANYAVTLAGNSSSTITPAALVLGGSRVYDGSTAVAGADLVATGVAGQTFAVNGAGAAGNIASRNVGSGALLNVAGLALGAGNGSASNYQALSAAGSSVTTTARAVTLAAPNLTKTYDASGAYTATSGDLAALGALLGVSGDTVSGATFVFTTVDAGNGNRTVATSAATVADGNNGANYVVSYGANTTSTIAKANLVLGGSRVFDGSTAVAGSTLAATGVAGQTFAVAGGGAAGNLASRNVGSGALQSVAGLSLGAGSGSASNYNALSTANSVYAVTPAALLLSGTRSYDGSTAVAGSSLVAQGVGGESFAVSGVGASSNLASRNAGSAALQSLAGLALGSGNGAGTLAGNYQALTTSGSAVTTTPKAVTLTAPVVAKVYDATTGYSAGAGDLAQIEAQLGVPGDAVSAATIAFTNANAGSGNRAVTLGGVTLADGNNGANYAVTLAGNGTSTITPAALVLAGSRVYDGSTAVGGAALVATGVAGQTFAVSGNGAAGNLASRNVGSGALQSVTGLALGAGNSGQALAANYQPLSTTASQFSVTPKAVTLAAPNLVKTYDASGAYSTQAADLAALGAQLGVAGDGVSAATFVFASADAGSGNRTVATSGVALADGNGGANYSVSLAQNTTSTINKADLVLSGSRVYDGSTSVAGGTLAATGVAGQTFGVSGAGAGGNLGSRNAGAAALASVAGLTVGAGNGSAGNYNALSTAGSSYTVTPALLVLTGTRSYDGTTVVTGAQLVAQGVAGESFGVAGNGASGGIASRDVGTAALQSLAGLALGSGNGGNALAANYQPLTTVGASVTTAQRAVTLTAPIVSKVYDATTAYTLSAADVATLTAQLGVQGDGISAANLAFVSADAGAGNRSVALGGVAVADGNGGANYAVTLAGNGTSTITPAALVLAGSRAYDGSTAAGGGALVATGVAGQTFAVSGNGAAGNLASRNVGSGALQSVTGLALGAGNSGQALAANYQPLSTTASQFSVTPKAVTLAAPNLVKTYDASGAYSTQAADLAALGAQLGVAGDGVSAATFVFASADAGSGNRTVATSGVALADGNGGANYSVSLAQNTTSTINKADLVLSGSRVYDGSTSVAGGTLAATGVAGQTFAVSGAGAGGNLGSRNVGAAALASVAGLTVGAGNGSAGNYNALSTAGSSYTVTPALLVLTGTRSYDGTTVVTGAQLVAQGVAGESFGVAGSGASGNIASRNVGTAALQSLAGLALGGGNGGNALAANYQPLTTVGASVTTAQRAVTLTAPIVSKVYDASTAYTLSAADVAALTAQLGVQGDGISAANLAFSSADAGAGNRSVALGGVAVADGNGGANYAVTLAGNAASTITPAALALGGGRTYDGSATAAGSTLTATGVAGQTFALNGSAQLASRNAGSAALQGVSGLSLGAGSGVAANYLPLSAAASSYTVAPKAVVLTAPVLVKTYDGNTLHVTTAADLAALGAQLGVAGDTVAAGTLAFTNANAGAANRGVAISGVTLADGNAGANYAVTLVGNSVSTIDRAALVLTGTRVYDGSTTVAGSALTASGVAGERFAVAGSGAAGNLASRNVGSGALQSVAGLALGNATAGNAAAANYLPLATAGSQVATTPLVLTLVAPVVTKTYDATTAYSASAADAAALGAQLAQGDSVQNVQLAYTDPNAGSANRTVNLLAATVADGNGGANYLLTLASNNASTIDRAPLVLSGQAGYTAGTAVAGSNLLATGVAGQTFSVTGSGASGNLSSPNVGSAALVNTSGLGVGSSGNGGLSGNYLPLTPAGAQFALTPVQLTLVNTTIASKPFDGSTAGQVAGIGNLVGVLGSDQVSATVGGAVFVDANPGTGKAVTLQNAALAGPQAGNYTLATPAAATGNIVSATTNASQSQAAAAAAVVPTVVPSTGSGGGLAAGNGSSLGSAAAAAGGTAATGATAAGGGSSGGTAVAVSPATLLAGAQPGQTLVAPGSIAPPAGGGLTAASLGAPPATAPAAIATVPPATTATGAAAATTALAAPAAAAPAAAPAALAAAPAAAAAAQPAAAAADPTAAAPVAAAPADSGTAPAGSAPADANATPAAPAAPATPATPAAPAAPAAAAVTVAAAAPVSAARLVTMAALPSGVVNTLAAAGVPAQSSVLVQSAVASGAPVPVAAPAAPPATTVATAPLPVVVTATAGAVQAQPASATPGFVSVRTLEPVTLAPGQPGVIGLPPDTFVHSAAQNGLRFEARMADGSPLPAWVRCNPANGDLAVNAPAAAPELLNVIIVARDDAGQSATTPLKVNLRR